MQRDRRIDVRGANGGALASGAGQRIINEEIN